MTLNRELFVKDPLDYVIPNDGVSKITPLRTEREWAVLRYELTSFVCEGEYERGLQRILDTYLSHLPRATQPAVWVSGFYGSGKSHLVRVLEHLWRDQALPDASTARGLATVGGSISDSLRELSTAARRIGAAPWSAAGTLDTANVEQLNLAFLAIVLRAAGLPDKVAPARLRLWLRDEGIEDAVVAALESQGRDVDRAIAGFHLSVPLAQAVLDQRPALATTPADLLQQFKAQFPDQPSVSVADTVELLRRVLTGVGGGVVPPTLVVLDEVQQYINDDPDRAMAVQHVVQAVSAEFEGRVLLVATGQQDLTSTPVLQKLQDRFSVKTHLENQDVDQVVRRVLLQKEPARTPELAAVIERAKGEISRELAGSRIAHRPSDDGVLLADYPLLPARRRFWEQVLRVADAGGRAGQLRSQLRVVHEANRRAAGRPVGTVVGADFLYDEKHSDLNQSGRLLKETQQLIADQAAHPDDGALRARILGLIHLISLLPTEGPADTGVRPTAEHLADLLVEDVEHDGHRLRARVPELLAALAHEGVVQQHGAEYRLQTAEGREWDQDYGRRRAALAADAAAQAAERDRMLREAVLTYLPARVPQGKVKEQRAVALQTGETEPQVVAAIPVWVRSEWDGVTRKQFGELARGAGQDSPVVFVHLGKVRGDELRAAVLDLVAAGEVLDARAHPTTEEGQEARAAMTSRRAAAQSRATAVIADVLAQATVELAG
ncbi:BREX system P-loop protein BrxC, partial [Actinotalea sp.]|uniref:BREX system P-loop protein BrxC n=1 Tax=Actinotalea sp. TaxID=1872145 RepID=UPI002CC9F090